MEGFLIQGWDLIFPGGRWLYQPQFPYGAGRYWRGGPPFSSPVCQSCGCMEGLMIREWDPVPPGWRWVYEPRLRFPHSARRYYQWRPPFLPLLVGVVAVWKDL